MDLRKALEIAINVTPELGSVELGIESAMNRVLAVDISADHDIPGQFRSRWDGFALRSEDTAKATPENPALLDIVPGLITAGNFEARDAVEKGCFRIMTGAVMPGGADVVVPLEEAQTDDDKFVVDRPLQPGQGVLPPWTDAMAGDLILRKGDVLTPARLALVAATGIGRIMVRRRPRVAVLATGDELRQTGCRTTQGAIFCNNIHLIAGLVSVCEGEAVRLGIAPDDPELIFSMLKKASADLIVTTGGMGRGSRDFILEVWERLGVAVHFSSLNMSPGKGSALGSIGKTLFLGLPGNPWAARIVFQEIASAIIRRLQGVSPLETAIGARAAVALENKKSFYTAIPGRLDVAGGLISFSPVDPGHPRPILPLMRNCPAYTMLSPGQNVREGEIVMVKAPELSLGAWSILRAKESEVHAGFFNRFNQKI